MASSQGGRPGRRAYPSSGYMQPAMPIGLPQQGPQQGVPLMGPQPTAPNGYPQPMPMQQGQLGQQGTAGVYGTQHLGPQTGYAQQQPLQGYASAPVNPPYGAPQEQYIQQQQPIALPQGQAQVQQSSPAVAQYPYYNHAANAPADPQQLVNGMASMGLSGQVFLLPDYS